MPFLRLSRDQRGSEHTFLMHAARPGDRPRVLYWYRTAPGLLVGRPPLDEEAIRTIEDHHPQIDFDWPAILALSEVVPLDEPSSPRPRKPAGRPSRGKEPAVSAGPALAPAVPEELPDEADLGSGGEGDEPAPHSVHSLLEELVGRDIATRLHARYAEVVARIDERHPPGDVREAWLRRAGALDPGTWVTPEAILEGVGRADGLFDELRRELLNSAP